MPNVPIEKVLRDAYAAEDGVSVHAVTRAVAVLYLLLAVAHVLVAPPPVARIMSPLAFISGLVLLVIHIHVARAGVRHGAGSAAPSFWLLVTGVIILTNGAWHLALTGDPAQSTNLMLLASGAGLVVQDRRVLAVIMAMSVAAWFVLAVREAPSPQWVHFGFALAFAVLLGVVVHMIRRRSIARAARAHARESDRRHELQAANRELEGFADTVSHDLRSPLRAIEYLTSTLAEDAEDAFDANALEILRRLRAETAVMDARIGGLLELARLGHGALGRETVDLSSLAETILRDLATRGIADMPQGHAVDVRTRIQHGVVADADPILMQNVLENLLGNSWKFVARSANPMIEFGAVPDADPATFFVRDNGAGFEPAAADRLFKPFQRLHAASEYGGTGIGLASVARIVRRHGGRAWATGAPGAGATFYFTLGPAQDAG